MPGFRIRTESVCQRVRFGRCRDIDSRAYLLNIVVLVHMEDNLDGVSVSGTTARSQQVSRHVIGALKTLPVRSARRDQRRRLQNNAIRSE